MQKGLFHRLCSMVLLLFSEFDRRRDARLEFMAAQIRILRRRLPAKHFKFTPEEHSELLECGAKLGHRVHDSFLVASFKTYRRWLRNRAEGKEPGRVGRKRTCASIAQLVLRMAKENVSWGYDRIVGELKKLSVKVSANTVKHILRKNGIHPTEGVQRRWNPARNWQRFIDSHLSSLLGCDFVSVKVFTWRGWVEAFVFVVIHLESRRVYMSPATLAPHHLWLAQQLRNVEMWREDEGIEAKYLIRDNDGKFGKAFDQAVESVGLETVRTSFFAPDMNAYVESHLSNCRRECLNHFVFFTLAQVDRVLRAWLRHYHHERPHQGRGIGNNVLDKTFQPQEAGKVKCRRSMGGLFNSYYRDAG